MVEVISGRGRQHTARAAIERQLPVQTGTLLDFRKREEVTPASAAVPFVTSHRSDVCFYATGRFITFLQL